MLLFPIEFFWCFAFERKKIKPVIDMIAKFPFITTLFSIEICFIACLTAFITACISYKPDSIKSIYLVLFPLR